MFYETVDNSLNEPPELTERTIIIASIKNVVRGTAWLIILFCIRNIHRIVSGQDVDLIVFWLIVLLSTLFVAFNIYRIVWQMLKPEPFHPDEYDLDPRWDLDSWRE